MDVLGIPVCRKGRDILKAMTKVGDLCRGETGEAATKGGREIETLRAVSRDGHRKGRGVKRLGRGRVERGSGQTSREWVEICPSGPEPQGREELLHLLQPALTYHPHSLDHPLCHL